MRIVFFGSGSPMSAAALRAIATTHDVALAITPPRVLGRRDRIRRLIGMLPPTPLESAMRELRVRAATYGADAEEVVRRANPELLVVASFPAILPERLLLCPAINLHNSLLPRHRGADPLFWTYHADDREAGNSVHWITPRADAGDVLAQEAIPLERGRPILELYHDLATRGAALLASTVDAIARGSARAIAQEASRATHEPSPLKQTWRIESDHWPAERTWHFLRGITPLYGAICRDAGGRPLPPLSPDVTLHAADGRVGEVEVREREVRFFCRDGVVIAARR